jgi:hypothetical protein
MKNQKPFDVKIVGKPTEIRMGSPHSICNIELVGFSIRMTLEGFYNKYAWSKDHKFLILIKWDTEGNEPGFKFYILNTISGSLIISERISGFVNDLKVRNQIVYYNKVLYDTLRTKGLSQVCSEHEYEISGQREFVFFKI